MYRTGYLFTIKILVCRGEEDYMKRKFITGVATATALASAVVPAMSNLPLINKTSTHTAEAATLDQNAFLNKAARQAQKASKKYGLYPSVMIAQAILESNWGTSTLATEANNLFGIKGGEDWAGQVYSARTREENKKGKSYYITANFRKYSSFEQSFEDNGNKLRNGVSWQPDRYKGAWIENAANSASATKALTGTYATDHKYDQSLNTRIAQSNLTKYDPKISKESKSYTVKQNAATYAWPTDHSVSAKSNSVKKGENVTVDKTITYYDGSKRMHIAGKGWVNSTVFKKGAALASTQAPKAQESQANKQVMHNAYLYNGKGKRVKGTKSLKEYSVVTVYGTKTIKGKKYYKVGEDRYVAAGNIDGTLRVLNHNTYVYNGSGNRDNLIVHKKGETLATYGKSVTIIGKKYYKIGIRQYVKVSNFAKQ